MQSHLVFLLFVYMSLRNVHSFCSSSLVVQPYASTHFIATVPTLARSMEKNEWSNAASSHRSRVLTHLGPLVVNGRILKDRHPVFNFLFHYYGMKFQSFLLYSPGPSIRIREILNEDTRGDTAVLSEKFLSRIKYLGSNESFDGFYDASCCSSKTIDSFRQNRELLILTSSRRPHLFCFGMHEWAMLYDEKEGAEQNRHQSLPLRISRSDLDNAVRARPLKCTHFDAFRFFSPSAVPFNFTVLTRNTQKDYEQPGCVHATMDLFKWAYKLSPFIDSNLLMDAFEIAIKARCLDMRASPYDLTRFEGDLGFDPSPIRVETVEGRHQYQELQMELFQESVPVRSALILAYDLVLSQFNS